jgi:hypothetical protein
MGLDELIEMKSALDKKLADEAEKTVSEEFAVLLQAHPRLQAVRWTQFTPHFNDGEPCEFGMNGVDVAVQGFQGSGSEEDDDVPGRFWIDDYTDRKTIDDDEVWASISAARALFKRLESIEEVCEAAFGDHAQITVTRDSIEVIEYEHD